MTGSLHREWAFVTGAGVIALSGAALLRPASLAGSAPVWAWCSWLLWRGLSDNRRKGETEPLPGLGTPTRITMLRGALVALSSGFISAPSLAAPAYTTAALLDGVDGLVARRSKRETVLGSKLDMEVDAIGILVASIGGILLGKLPLGYVAVGLARYVFVVGVSTRVRLAKPVRDLDPSPLRRVLAGVQMGFLAATLWPHIPSELSRAVAYPLGAATLLMFLRDWLFSSCRLR